MECAHSIDIRGHPDAMRSKLGVQRYMQPTDKVRMPVLGRITTLQACIL